MGGLRACRSRLDSTPGKYAKLGQVEIESPRMPPGAGASHLQGLDLRACSSRLDSTPGKYAKLGQVERLRACPRAPGHPTCRVWTSAHAALDLTQLPANMRSWVKSRSSLRACPRALGHPTCRVWTSAHAALDLTQLPANMRSWVKSRDSAHAPGRRGIPPAGFGPPRMPLST